MTIAPTSESLLCTPLGYDLESATPVQRARARIGDGLPLEELRTDPDVIAMVGGPEAIEALPSERGIAPAMLVDASSIRSAKTMLACCRATRAVFTVDTSPCRIGEVVRIPVFSLKLSRARVAFRLLCALWSRPQLKPLVLSQTAEALMVRSPSGVPFEICCVAGGRAAGDFLSDWLGKFIADEAPRMLGRDEGTTNLADALTATRGRLLPGATIDLIGSPWSPSGPVFDLVQEHFGKPTERVVILRSNGMQNNPGHFTKARCAEMEETDPVAYSTSVLGEFSDPVYGLLEPASIRSSTREAPLELPFGPGGEYSCGVDPSDGGAGNAFSCVIIRHEKEVTTENHRQITRSRYRVALAEEFRGLGADGSWRAVAARCQRYGISRVTADAYSGSAGVALAKVICNLEVTQRRLTLQTKNEAYTDFAELVHGGRFEFPNHKVFLRDMRSIKKKITQQSQAIDLPFTPDGRHCDFAPAIIAALGAASSKRFSYGMYNDSDSKFDFSYFQQRQQGQ